MALPGSSSRQGCHPSFPAANDVMVSLVFCRYMDRVDTSQGRDICTPLLPAHAGNFFASFAHSPDRLSV